MTSATLATALKAFPKPTKEQLKKIKKWKTAQIIRDILDACLDSKIKILEHGGYAQFPVIVNTKGEAVSDDRVDAYYGIRWNIDGVWYTESVHPESKLTQDGFRIEPRWFPAWVKQKSDKYRRSYPLIFKIDKPKYGAL